MEMVFDLVSVPGIMALPWYLGVPMLGLAALAGLSGLLSLVRLRVARAVVQFALAVAILLVASHGGDSMARLMGGPPAAEAR